MKMQNKHSRKAVMEITFLATLLVMIVCNESKEPTRDRIVSQNRAASTFNEKDPSGGAGSLINTCCCKK